jgi:cyclase
MTQQVSIMPCLDMQAGRVVKGVHFVDICDAGDPVECARAYCAAGADELALLDITATVEGRGTMLDVVKRVAQVTTVPFTVGGGISDVASAAEVLDAGANKISTSSAATGVDAIEWAKKVDAFGVPVILPTSKAGDGAKTGYDLPVIRAMKEATTAQIVASGGAGKLEHFYEAVEAGATILLAASVFHFRMIGIPQLKDYLRGRGVDLP